MRGPTDFVTDWLHHEKVSAKTLTFEFETTTMKEFGLGIQSLAPLTKTFRDEERFRWDIAAFRPQYVENGLAAHKYNQRMDHYLTAPVNVRQETSL